MEYKRKRIRGNVRARLSVRGKRTRFFRNPKFFIILALLITVSVFYSLFGISRASADYVEGIPFIINVDAPGAPLTLDIPYGLSLLYGGNGYNGAGALIVQGAAKLTFTAVADDYILQLKDENGDNVGAPIAFTVLPTSQTATYGEDLTLNANTFTRTGYTFIGWNTEADGSGTSYTDEQQFTPWDITSDLTLYAQWKKNSEPSGPNPPADPLPDGGSYDDLPSDDNDDDLPPNDDDDDDLLSVSPPPDDDDSDNRQSVTPPRDNDGDNNGGDDDNRQLTYPQSVSSPDPSPSPTHDIMPDPTPNPQSDPAPGQTPNQTPHVQSSDATPIPGSREVFKQDERPTDDELLFILEDDGVPLFSFFDTPIPLFGSPSTQNYVWAVVNLILSIAGIILAIFAVFRMLARKKRGDKNEHDENAEAHQKQKKKNRKIWLTVSIVMGIAGIIVFLLTEDTTKLMVLLDRWTIVNAIIFIIEAVGFGLAFKRKKKHDEYTAYHIGATPATAG